MVIIQSFAVAVGMLIITMLCWGSWANTQKLATREWPFQLFYWDYSIGIVFLSIVLGHTLGSTGSEGRHFVEDLHQSSTESFISAFLGGVIFNLGNILLVAAIDIAGMAVAFPVAVGLALVIGVISNYIKYPQGNPLYLFVGLSLVVLAIIFDSLAYRRISAVSSKPKGKGLFISLGAGILMGFFFRFVADSMSQNFANPEPGKFTPYTALFVFSIGLFFSNFLWNTIVMKKPFTGSVVHYRDYFKKGNFTLHGIGWLGGIIWALGMGFSLIASEKAGFAISYGLGQGATMVAALWGVFVWKEFKNADAGTRRLINLMFLLFILGLGLIIYSRISS